MFVKKDLRKIPQILSESFVKTEEEDEKTTGVLRELRLARRPAEFQGSIAILCQPEVAPALTHLQVLSLYDCNISNLNGIGSLKGLTELNVGRNPLTTLPSELSLGSLTSLWCDDCNVSGPLPDCLYELEKLEVLRMSNNQITELCKDGISKWKNLKTLCLDGNQMETVPSQMSQLANLKTLLLRQNKLRSLPEGVPGPTMSQLSFFNISSNELQSLPSSIVNCTSLEKVYVNCNQISTIPNDFAKNLSNLMLLNISHNLLQTLPHDFIDRFGHPDPHSGECTKDVSCQVRLEQNPILENVMEL